MTANEYNYDFKILKSVMQVNRIQKSVMVNKVSKYFGENLNGKTFALWGLAFKPNTDDIREAPALYIIDEMMEMGAKFRVYDPEAMANVKEIYGDRIHFCNDEYEALDGASALIIATEWNEFRTPDFAILKQKLAAPIIFDGRNLYPLDEMKANGFYYESIGREIVG